MTKLLEGRTALVTGAGSGIGRDLALALAEMGARVGVAVRRIDAGEETVRLVTEEDGEAHVVRMDVSDEASVANGIAAFVDMVGGLDIMIHNANNSTSAYPAPADNVDRGTWQAQSQVALGGAFLTAREAFPHLKRSRSARYLTFGSAFGFHGASMNTIYAGQKSSFRAFVRSLAREWGPDGITVNAIAPSAATEPTQYFFDQNPAMRDAYMRKFPMGRMGHPRRDIAAPVAMLCTEQFAYMTGQIIFLDGGLYPTG
jgi:3-oxoacyl-[acyl-carrier protein] reductase